MGTAGPQPGCFCRFCDEEKCIQSLRRLGCSVIPFARIVEGPQGNESLVAPAQEASWGGRGRDGTGQAGSGSRSAGCRWVSRATCSLWVPAGGSPAQVDSPQAWRVLGVWWFEQHPGPPAGALVPRRPWVPWVGGFAAAAERGGLPPAPPTHAGPVCKHSPPAAALPAATGLFLWVLLLLQEAVGGPLTEARRDPPPSCPRPHCRGQPTCAPPLVDGERILSSAGLGPSP